MLVDVCSPSTIDVDGGCARFIPAHSAWSRDLYQSAATTFTGVPRTVPGLRRGQAQVGRKDIIFIKYPLATAKDLPKGL